MRLVWSTLAMCLFAGQGVSQELTFEIEGTRQTTISTTNLMETLSLYLEGCV